MYRADPARTQEKRFAWLPWAVAAGLALASVALMMVATQNRVATTVSLPVTRFEIRFPQDHDLYRAGGGEITLAPDGRSVFYIGMSTSGFALYRRPLDQLNSVVIPGSEARALSHPTPSPDGLSLVYYKEGQLTRIATTGGTPRNLTTVPGNFGVTWADERTVVFNERGRRLWQIPAAGGMPTALTGASRADAVTYRYPAMLPGGSVVAYTRWSGTLQSAKVAIRSMRSGEERVLFDGSNPRLTPSGHLLFARGDGIWAIGINSETLQAVGEPVRVLENVTVNSGGLALFGISASGTLAYVPGSVGSQRTLVWVDRNGRENTLEIPSGAYSHPRISPDGRQVVVTRVAADGNEDIWLIDASTAQMRRVTSDPASDVAPVWTPDGRALVFGSSRGGGWGMWRQAVEGPEGAERIPGAPVGLPLGFAADGALLVQESRSDGISRVMAVGGTTGAGQRVLAERKGMTNGALSPDGLWLAYQSNQSGETGQSEIYLVEMSTNQQWKVSADGGEEPAWSSDGRELFYRALDVSATSTIAGGLMSVRVQTAPSVTVSAASQVLGPRYFRGGGERLARYLGPITGERQYDVSRDGQRFLMLKQPVGGTIVVVQNWFEELKQRVPVR